MGFEIGPEEDCIGIPWVASFSLPPDRNSWHIVDFSLFASLWGKRGAELQENKFCYPQASRQHHFHSMSKGEQLGSRALVCLEKYPEHFRN